MTPDACITPDVASNAMKESWQICCLCVPSVAMATVADAAAYTTWYNPIEAAANGAYKRYHRYSLAAQSKTRIQLVAIEPQSTSGRCHRRNKGSMSPLPPYAATAAIVGVARRMSAIAPTNAASNSAWRASFGYMRLSSSGKMTVVHEDMMKP